MQNNFPYPENALILAPLSGYTDLPYRRSMRRHGCKFAFTEMIDAGSLAFRNRKTLRCLERADDEDFLGAQIVGSDTKTLAIAAQVISEYNFNLLDFNLGCPAPKVVRKGEGAALARNYDAACRAFETLRKNYHGILTAKMRIISDEDPEPTAKLAKALEDIGASAITVHGRTAKQFYSGPVHYKIMRAVKDSLKIQFIANGGVYSISDYQKMITELKGTYPIMLAGGAMGNPWLFEEILKKENFIAPSPAKFADEIKMHIIETCKYYGTEIGLRISRKFILDYLKGRGYSSSLKNNVVKIKNLDDFENFLCEIRKGPSEGYFKWLEKNPLAPRKISRKL